MPRKAAEYFVHAARAAAREYEGSRLMVILKWRRSPRVHSCIEVWVEVWVGGWGHATRLLGLVSVDKFGGHACVYVILGVVDLVQC
jgi:hypothetical protein